MRWNLRGTGIARGRVGPWEVAESTGPVRGTVVGGEGACHSTPGT